MDDASIVRLLLPLALLTLADALRWVGAAAAAERVETAGRRALYGRAWVDGGRR